MIFLKLKKPFNPGSYDAGNTYPHALVTNFNMAAMDFIIEIRFTYGTFDTKAGWRTGPGAISQTVHIQGQDFYEAISAKPDPKNNDSVLMAVARQCYEYLVKSGVAEGDVVEDYVAEAPQDAPAEGDAG